jgi:hypothetical protein
VPYPHQVQDQAGSVSPTQTTRSLLDATIWDAIRPTTVTSQHSTRLLHLFLATGQQQQWGHRPHFAEEEEEVKSGFCPVCVPLLWKKDPATTGIR